MFSKGRFVFRLSIYLRFEGRLSKQPVLATHELGSLCFLLRACVCFVGFLAGLSVVQSDPQVYADYYKKSKLKRVAMKQVCMCVRA